MKHRSIFLYGRYAPWLSDVEFIDTYLHIRHKTMIDEYRAFQLWDLLPQLKYVPGDILEAGCWKGGIALLMNKRATICGLDCKVIAVDTFTGVVKVGNEDSNGMYIGGEHPVEEHEQAEIIQELEAANVQVLRGIFPDDTGNEIADTKFRLCHIDVDVYKSAKDIFVWCWERLSPRGIVVFDDYGFESCTGITKFVNEIVTNEDNLIIYNLTGQAIMVKL